MKKLILFILLTIGIVANILSQSTYYDVLKLKDKAIPLEDGKITFSLQDITYFSEILKKYVPEAKDYTALVNSFRSNPFIKLPELNALSRFDISNLKPGQILSNFGDLDVTNFADGIAKFIVKRTKQELSTEFFVRFKKDLDSLKQFQILFPATYTSFKVIDTEIYNFSAYLDLLHDSFQKDLALLLPDINKLINDKSMDVVFSKYPEIRIILSDAFFIANEFSEGKHPGDVLHNYIALHADSNSLYKIEPDLYSSLRVFDLVSQSLRSKQSDQYWVKPDSLKLLLDETTFNIYLGLIYQQSAQTHIVFGSKPFTEILKSFKDKTKPYMDYLTGLISKGENANYYYKAIKEKQGTGKDKPTYQDYFSLYDATLNVFEYLVEFPGLSDYHNSPKVIAYFTSARSLGNIYVDIYEKQYSSAVVEFSSIYSTLILPKVESEIEFISSGIDSIKIKIGKEKDTLKRKSLEATMDMLQKKVKNLKQIQETSPALLKYGTFAATIAKAENSDEVQNAIEAIALPQGSSRVKRESEVNISLNAYCGLFGGRNFGSKTGYYSYGITAPVGIALSTGKKHFSYSLYVSVIDLGAVTAFRVKNDTATVSKILLRDIVSPGLFFSWGLKNCPISLNAGCQLTPLLSSVSSSENSYEARMFRFTVGLCVDIPVLNLYNRSR